MRLPLILAALTVSAPAASEGPPIHAGGIKNQAPAVLSADPVQSDECRPTRARLADGVSGRGGEGLKPRKLNELPGGAAYMAVFRTINGCEAPMTVAEYRRGSSR